MAGVAEADLAKKHQWNLRAIEQADAVADRGRVRETYASNLNNLGLSYAQLGEAERARETFAAALRHADDLPPGAYGEQVRASIRRNLERLQAG